MKKKVMIKSLPKAQVGIQQPPIGLTEEQKAIWQKNQGMFGNPVSQPLDFKVPVPDFLSMYGQGENILRQAPLGTSKKNDLYGRESSFAPGFGPQTATQKIEGQVKNSNPYIAQALLAGTDLFRSIGKKVEGADAQNNFKNQFLSDRLYAAKQDDVSGNRGDYLTNTPGFGLDFRPNEAIYGDYNKIAQMGGEMKRKVKITSLPQAGYGGAQDAKTVNQLYGNSAYMMNMFNGATKGVPQEEYNNILTPDPRSASVLEAEKGETLVRKGTNSTIPELFTIGGKRHSEGGTPLGPEKATPDSFIYSDTKAMKIKDPDVLKSFGLTPKKGGYTPAMISKKFNLNSKDLREGLYTETDPLRKSTAILMTDNYISNLGKLALVQESKKGFPQGAPEIAKPYMEKVGLDPTQFLPPSAEEGMAMAMYGGIPKAQIGTSVGSVSNTTSTDPYRKHPHIHGNYDPSYNQEIQKYMAADKAANEAEFNNSSMLNPMNWGKGINYRLTGQFENMGDSHAKWFGEDYRSKILRYATEPAVMATAAMSGITAPLTESAFPAATRMGTMLSNTLGKNPGLQTSLQTGLTGLKSGLSKIMPALGVATDLSLPYIEKLAGPAALAILIGVLDSDDQSLTPEQQTELLKKLDTEQVDQLLNSPVGAKVSSDSLMEAAKSNPDIDFNRLQDTIIKVKPSAKTKTQTKQEVVNDGWGEYEYGGNIPEYQNAGEVLTEVEKPNPYAKVFVGEIANKKTGKKASIYYEGDQKYLVDEEGNEIQGSRKTRTADDIKFTQYGSPEIVSSIDDRVRKGKKVIYTKIPAGQFSNQPRLKNTGIYLPSADAASRKEGTLSANEWKDFQNRHGDWIDKEYTGGFSKFKQDLETSIDDPEKLKNLDTPGNKAAAWFQDKVNEKSIKSTGKPYFKTKDNSKNPYQKDMAFGRVTYSVPNFFDDDVANVKTTTTTDNREEIQPNELNTNAVRNRPIGFYPQDILNTAAAVGDLASINRYYPRMTQFTPESMKPTYYDPNRELANNAEMANIAAQNMSQFTGPQAFNARFAETQGKGLANAANILGRYNNLNVGVANQFEQANNQLRNEANFKNAMMANDFYDKTNITNQQYDNSMRQARRELVDYTNAALTNRFMTDQMNSLYPNFYVEPSRLKTYYTPGQQLTPKQKGNDMMAYLNATGIPFDFTNPSVQTALLKGMMGDVNTDERGNIIAASAAINNRRKK